MRLFHGFVLAIILLVPTILTQEQAHGQEPVQEDGPLAVALADAATQDSSTGRYAYVRHIRIDSKDEVLDRVEHFDPARSEGSGWTLLLVNGKAPTSEEISEYEKSAGDGEKTDNVSGIYQDVTDDLDLEDAELLEETDTQAIYRFLNVKSDFLGEDGDELSGHLESRLVVDKKGSAPFVSSMRIYAPGPVEKGMMAKVNAFETAFSFMRHDETGDVLPQKIHVEVSVEALLFFNIDALTRVEFSDFEVRGD